MRNLVLIKGAGDIATGIAHRLFKSGFSIVMTELEQPTVIRRSVAFAEAVFSGRVEIEGVLAEKTAAANVFEVVSNRYIAVVIDSEAKSGEFLNPWAVVDAILAKSNMGTSISDAPIVIGVGPGFIAGQDVHAVIETMRGHYLGRVITSGTALADTGIPGDIAGYTKERIVRAPCQGRFIAVSKIADKVSMGDIIGYINGKAVISPLSGILRGLLHDGLVVYEGMKIGDVDPRCVRQHCFSISDKARAVGGGVLEVLCSFAAGSDKHEGI